MANIDRASPYETSSRILGERGEQAAARWYESHGWVIVGRNWRCREGELDVIAERGDTVAFCEVKARSSTRFADPALAIDRRKQQRVRRAAARWLAGQAWVGSTRFDAAIVVGGRVRMIENAF